MSLLAYNLTIAPLALTGVVPVTTLPASASAGARGPALNVTGELKPLTAPQFAALQVQVAAGQVQYEWSGLPEFNTFTLVVGSAQTDVSDLPINIYANSITGDDVAGDGSLANPYQTFQRAWVDQPTEWRSTCEIHLATGQYPLTFEPGSPDLQLYSGRPVGDKAKPIKVVSGAIDQLGGPQVVVSVLNTVVAPIVTTIDATVVTVDGTLRGAYYRNLASPTERARIVDNVNVGPTTTFTLDRVVTVAPGDSFVIERPGGEILLDPARFLVLGGATVFSWENIKFTAPFGFFGLPFLVVGSIQDYAGCEIHLQGVFQTVSGKLGNHLSGLYVHADIVGFMAVTNLSGQQGDWMIDNCLVAGGYDGFFNYSSLFANNSDFFPAACSFSIERGKITGGGNFGLGQIVPTNCQTRIGADFFSNSLDKAVNISGSKPGTAGVYVNGGAALIGGVEGINDTYGFVTSSAVVSTSATGRTTISGGTDDMLIGAFPKAYIALPFANPLDFSLVNKNLTNA